LISKNIKLHKTKRKDDKKDDDFPEKEDDLFEINKREFHRRMEEEMKLEDEMEQDKIMDKFKSTIRISARVRKELK
jgi:hypothetical protein